MVRSRTWVFGVASLCWHTPSVLGRDGDDQEYFPLSGGVADGINVRIKADKVTGIGVIDFLTPERKSAFQWTMDKETSKVTRNSELPDGLGLAESFGGWGLNVDEEIKIDFYKTKFSWAVSINDVRFPQFDFTLRDTSLMTHVSVHSGFENVEVVQTRRECRTTCHTSECMKSDGTDTCPHPGGCTSTVPSDGTYSSSCSNSTDTGSSTPLGSHCCDGIPKSIGMSEDNVGKWAAVIDDAALVKAACDAFGTEVKACEVYIGQKVNIAEFHASTGSYKVWVPSAITAPLVGPGFEKPATSFYNYPALALKPSFGAGRKFVELGKGKVQGGGQMGSDVFKEDAKFRVDGHNGLVYMNTADSLARDQGTPLSWFIELIGFVQDGEFRWFVFSNNDPPVIKTLRAPTAGVGENRSQTVKMLLFDEQKVTRPECLDDRPFADPKGYKCADYTRGNETANTPWCNRHAEPTQDWCKLVGTHIGTQECKLERGGQDAKTRLHAGFECCQCGGGTISAPVEDVDEEVLFQ